MNNDIKVMIGTPMYGSQCYHGYVAGIIETIKDFQEHNIGYDCHFLGSDSLVTRARNHIVDKFLKSDCTHLIFIDADIYFPGDAIRKLLETGHDFVCAPYPLKEIDWNKVQSHFWASLTQKTNNQEDMDKIVNSGSCYVINHIDPNNIPDPDENQTIKVAHSGTGFMLLSRKVFNKMSSINMNFVPLVKKTRTSTDVDDWYTEFFKTEVDGNSGLYLSEDWSFCRNWRDSGGEVYLRLDIELTHMGMYMYKGSIQNAQKFK